MDVYNGSFNDFNKSNFIFEHLSTSNNAAAERIKSMFAAKERCALNTDFNIDLIDINDNATKTFEECPLKFFSYAGKHFNAIKYYLYSLAKTLIQ